MSEQPCRQCGRPAGPIGLCRECYLERRPAPEQPGHVQGQVGNGRFRLLRPLGEGGHGSVFLARDEPASQHGEEKLVALKFLGERTADDPKAMDRLRNEMWLARKLSHPNVVNVFDLHEHPGERIFYSMEYVPGSDLRSYLAASATGRLTGTMIESWVEQIADGLGYCHTQARVFHRDLKPANIVLSPEGVIRLVDFGIAYADTSGSAGFAQKALTRAYASPQQIRGDPASAMDDMYALGATLYHLVTGVVPAPAGTETIHPRRRILESRGSPKDLSPEASETIMRCLSEDPMQRPASMAQFWKWYSQTGPVEEDQPEHEPWPWDRIWDGVRYAAIVCLLAVAGTYLNSRIKQVRSPETRKPTVRTEDSTNSGAQSNPPVAVTKGVLDLQIRLPARGAGLVYVTLVPVDGGTGVEPVRLERLADTNVASGRFTLDPGRYWIDAGQGDVRFKQGWLRSGVVIGTNHQTMELSLVAQPVDLRMDQEVGLHLLDYWSNRITLRSSDRFVSNNTFRLIGSDRVLTMVPGQYRMELVPEMREDWILDDPILDLRTHLGDTRVIRPRKRLYPRMNAEWTASGAAQGLLTSEWKFVPVPGHTNLLGSTTEVAIGQFEPFAREIGLADPIVPPRFAEREPRLWRKPFPDSTDSHPVVGITWHEATNFAGWLTLKCRQGGQLTERQRFRLPTCAEWTAMAGPARYPWGDEFPPSEAVANLAGQELTKATNWPPNLWGFPFVLSTNSGTAWPMRVDQLHSVRGQFRALGGNVAEWCEDDYHPQMNPPEPWKDMPDRLKDPALQAGCKVVRGGSWITGHEPELLQTSTHWPERPDTRSDTIGFRLVIVEE